MYIMYAPILLFYTGKVMAEEHAQGHHSFSLRLDEREASALLRKAGLVVYAVQDLPPYFYRIFAGTHARVL